MHVQTVRACGTYALYVLEDGEMTFAWNFMTPSEAHEYAEEAGFKKDEYEVGHWVDQPDGSMKFETV